MELKPYSAWQLSEEERIIRQCKAYSRRLYGRTIPSLAPFRYTIDEDSDSGRTNRAETLSLFTDFALFHDHPLFACTGRKLRVSDLPTATKDPTSTRHSRLPRVNRSNKSIFDRLPLEVRRNIYGYLVTENDANYSEDFLGISKPYDYAFKMWFSAGYNVVISFPIQVLSVSKQMQDEVLEELCKRYNLNIFVPHRVLYPSTLPNADGNTPRLEEMDIRKPHTYVPSWALRHMVRCTLHLNVAAIDIKHGVHSLDIRQLANSLARRLQQATKLGDLEIMAYESHRQDMLQRRYWEDQQINTSIRTSRPAGLPVSEASPPPPPPKGPNDTPQYDYDLLLASPCDHVTLTVFNIDTFCHVHRIIKNTEKKVDPEGGVEMRSPDRKGPWSFPWASREYWTQLQFNLRRRASRRN
ncbi:hypothetical protein K490DRAFT_54939 [Saccharata proteae CBS 121410]|uniref:F-box domain-containing protein n=1 Tax=Saccharata proteae CBS 121410 TaxID=1314787 RepID=A0A6A5YBS3_9PEZI|nr:hypothetical protein K490DRAFT_54939 [Saccharata proteae CBS 121410]